MVDLISAQLRTELVNSLNTSLQLVSMNRQCCCHILTLLTCTFCHPLCCAVHSKSQVVHPRTNSCLS
jgi:hypothetical protein